MQCLATARIVHINMSCHGNESKAATVCSTDLPCRQRPKPFVKRHHTLPAKHQLRMVTDNRATTAANHTQIERAGMPGRSGAVEISPTALYRSAHARAPLSVCAQSFAASTPPRDVDEGVHYASVVVGRIGRRVPDLVHYIPAPEPRGRRRRIFSLPQKKTNANRSNRSEEVRSSCALSRVLTTSTGVEKTAETRPAVPEAPKCASGPSGIRPLDSRLVLAVSYTPISHALPMKQRATFGDQPAQNPAIPRSDPIRLASPIIEVCSFDVCAAAAARSSELSGGELLLRCGRMGERYIYGHEPASAS